VYALEEVGDHLFIASEFVSGETLREEIGRGPIAPERARAIALSIAGALAAAHDAGVIHRDLKPENVLIKPDGRREGRRFRHRADRRAGSHATDAGGIDARHAAYMAPEQLLGQTVDGRADIYAWGIVFSEMLTGVHPLQGRHKTNNVHLTGTFATVIAHCLHADPAARYPNAAALISELGSRLGASLGARHGDKAGA
jgi:serine/threonine-protein kinase